MGRKHLIMAFSGQKAPCLIVSLFSGNAKYYAHVSNEKA